jgi:hypothetical protein
MRTYTLYRLLELNEGTFKDAIDFHLTDDIEAVKRNANRFNDTTNYDKRFYISVVSTLELEEEDYKDLCTALKGFF